MKRYRNHLLAGIMIMGLWIFAGCVSEQSGEEIQNADVSGVITSGEVLTLSAGSGVYPSEFVLTVTPPEGSVIYYTTDGSNPMTSSTRLTYQDGITISDRLNDENIVSAVSPSLFDAANAAVSQTKDSYDSVVSAPSKEDVDKCTVIKMTALQEDGSYTPVATETYFVGDMTQKIPGLVDSSEAAQGSLAIISITMDYDDLFDASTGIYVKGDIYEDAIASYLASGKKLKKDDARSFEANYTQRGRDWEREASITFFESDGVNTECVLQQDCGIRIQGNFSRSDLQKGFRLFARSDYGDNRFRYPVFGDSLRNDEGEVMDEFKTLTLRNGGNCAFTTKYSDTYWQKLLPDMVCETQESRPCVVYLNGEYWGVYILQEDYSQEYFEDTHGVEKDDVVLYKADAEKYAIGYKLDLGDLPEGETEVSYYYQDLIAFFNTHDDLTKQEDYDAFIQLVDPDSVLDYFAAQIWINNKWDWPGKNWSMWRTIVVDPENEYADGRWRFCYYDMEFGGVSGTSDATTNTIKEDNYKPYGLLDRDTENPAVLCFVYLMSNPDFRVRFLDKLQSLGDTNFEYTHAMEELDRINAIYTPLFDQFFARYGGVGSTHNSVSGGYASYQCIADFLEARADNIQKMVDYVNDYYDNHFTQS